VTIHNAIYGSLVADAAALGLHWLYDADHIAQMAAHGELSFRAPDANVFKDRKGVFVHHGKASGDLSHYGESVRLMAQLVLNEPYSTERYREKFNQSFGPCGAFRGYADRPTKALIARMIVEGDKLSDPSGMDDNQMPGFAVLPGLFAAGASEETVLSAAQVLTTNQDVLDGIVIALDCLKRLEQGDSLSDALEKSVDASQANLTALLKRSLAIKDYAPVAVSDDFGKACYVEHAMPVVWHILRHATNFEDAITDNIRCGGDSCGRGILLGAIAGVAFGVPSKWGAKLVRGALPVARERLD